MSRCPVCMAPLIDGASYCPFCGHQMKISQKFETYRCWIHKNRFAPFRCEVCGRLICKECRFEHSNKHICKICYMSILLPKKIVTKFQHDVKTSEEQLNEDEGLIIIGGGRADRGHNSRSGYQTL